MEVLKKNREYCDKLIEIYNYYQNGKKCFLNLEYNLRNCPVCYNGDIFTVDDHNKLIEAYEIHVN